MYFSPHIPGVDISMSKLPMLPIAECVDVSIFHQHNCKPNEIKCLSAFTKKIKKMRSSWFEWGNEPTWMMKTTADLYSSQLAVKSHSTGGIGGDFAGILLATLAATIYNTNVYNQAFWVQSGGGISGSCRLQRCVSLRNPGKQIWKEKNGYNRNGGKRILDKMPLKHKGFWLQLWYEEKNFHKQLRATIIMAVSILGTQKQV